MAGKRQPTPVHVVSIRMSDGTEVTDPEAQVLIARALLNGRMSREVPNKAPKEPVVLPAVPMVQSREERMRDWILRNCKPPTLLDDQEETPHSP